MIVPTETGSDFNAIDTVVSGTKTSTLPPASLQCLPLWAASQ